MQNFIDSYGIKKTDKINRQDLDVCTHKLRGGLNMVNIILFEKALKLSWNPKPLSNADTLNHISSMGPEWCITLLKI